MDDINSQRASFRVRSLSPSGLAKPAGDLSAARNFPSNPANKPFPGQNNEYSQPENRRPNKKPTKIGFLGFRYLQYLFFKTPLLIRVGIGISILLIVAELIVPIYQGENVDSKYDLTKLEGTILSNPIDLYADKLVFQPSTGGYVYNQDYKPGSADVAGSSAGPKVGAEFKPGDGGVSISDPVNEVNITFKPKFSVSNPRKDKNRIVYPVDKLNASNVYTLKASGVKEDIVIHKFQGDELEFKYDLEVSEGTEVRLEKDGSLAVYGVGSALLGNVSAGTEQDAELLKKARENGEKSKLLFRIPKPVVLEAYKKQGPATAVYKLDGKELTISASGLKDATYPLTIDPSVYVETATKLMRGNNETNVDFDVDNQLIQKSQTTGARIDEWTDTMNLPSGHWDNSVAAAGGYVYSAGGRSFTNASTVYSSTGANTFNVPSGVTSITVELWGAGGGGGGGGSVSRGGTGGGGGYATTTLAVTALESLNVYVGGGGGLGTGRSDSGDGGGGGGHTEINRGGTNLIIAPGGGGGGGGDNDTPTVGGAGGAGGTTTGITGDASGLALGGAGGTQASGGAAGTGGSNTGTAGGAETAGDGADGRSSAGSDGGANNGGAADDGDGGTGSVTNNYAGGGGGGGGFYGGGGGAGSANGDAGGGGGGSGSCYTTGFNGLCIAGSTTNPGNASDSDRAGIADGGTGGAVTANGTAGEAGRIVIYYSTASALSASLRWAHFNADNETVEAPNPGTGACASWCTSSVYDMDEARIGASMVAYNGYLYMMGGSDGTNRESTVWIAKIGVNGEPQLWHPTDTNKASWDYWYADTGLNGATARSYFSAVAYNNRMYVLGGQTNASAGGVTTVEVADVLPNGRLGTWTATGMQALPSARHGHNVHIYNDVMYLIGGDSSGTLQNSVYYSKISSTGTMNPWTATASFTTARSSFGGNFTAIWGAYIYLSGGCTALTSGYCSTVASDTQIASINADGTLSAWGSISGLANNLMGYNLLGWQNGLYRVGGCVAQNTSTGACYFAVDDVYYGVINPAGEVSTVDISVPSGTAPCSGVTPYSCDLPTVGDDAGEVGHMLTMTTILNGYLYVIGGCAEYDCNTGTNTPTTDNISSNTAFTAIDSNGRLSIPTTCGGTSYGAWCVDSTNTINGADGVAAAGIAVFGGRIYVLGGIDSAGLVTGELYYNTPNATTGAPSAWTAQDLTTLGITEDIFYTYIYTRASPSTASTYPGNLYVFGGCGNGGSGAGCGASDYETEVYKCNITTTGALEVADANDCTTSGQMQIDSSYLSGGTDGLGIHSGTVYANYVYLVGGYSQAEADKDDVLYAKIDDNNNIVAADGGSAWIESGSHLSTGRRRGWSFGYNGHIYSLGGYDGDGSTIIPFIEWSKMDVSDGSIDPFVTSSITIKQRWGLSVAVSNSYAYVFGGCDVGASPGDCTSFEPAVQTFQLYNNDSGAINDYTAQSDDTYSDVATEDRWGASSTIYNGYLYVAGGCISATDCTNATNSTQYAPISATDGTIGTWAAGGNLPADRAWGSLQVVGGSLYYVGGQSDTATDERAEVYYTSGISSGNPTWNGTAATNGLPAARTKFGSAVWDDRLYVVGGLDGSAATSAVVYVSPKLSSGGDIPSAWSTSTSINVARTGAALTAYANNLYLFGGFDGTNYLNDVQYASFGYKTGTISQAANTVTGSGTTFTISMVGSVLQYSDGSTATITGHSSATSITVDVSKTVPASTNYIIQDGSVGSWSFSTSLPGTLRDAQAFSANGYIYLIGGRSAATTCLPNTLITPISANTTIATGNNPTGVGEWYETNTRYATDRYGAAVSYANGKFYTMGGGCTAPIDCSTASICNYHSTVKSQPQVAKYSRMIDTDTDVFPTYWLLNGLDNSIGARWQLKYRSMHDLDTVINPSEDCGTSQTMTQMSTWGHEYSFGNVTLGTPGVYVPRNATSTSAGTITQSGNAVTGSGTSFTSDLLGGLVYYADGTTATITAYNSATSLTVDVSRTIAVGQNYTAAGGDINCARYFYLSVSIDASRTFGYPEDVNRGPTISDLSLFFTADPSKRLRHGKTFTGGEQQPLDTPF